MKYMRKAVYAGVVGGLLALAASFANAVPQVTADEVWIMAAAALSGFITGGVTYLVRNEPEFLGEGTATSLAGHSSRTVGGTGHTTTWTNRPKEK